MHGLTDPDGFANGNTDPDDLALGWREALMSGLEPDGAGSIMHYHDLPEPVALAMVARVQGFDRDTLSLERLGNSLCPLHGRDMAICADDDDPTCAPIRECFPTFDT